MHTVEGDHGRSARCILFMARIEAHRACRECIEMKCAAAIGDHAIAALVGLGVPIRRAVIDHPRTGNGLAVGEHAS